MFIKSYYVRDNITSTRDPMEGKNRIRVLMNLHLKVECGERHTTIVIQITLKC